MTYYERNRGKVLAKAKARYAADPSKKRSEVRQWRTSNPSRYAEIREASYAKNGDRWKDLRMVRRYGITLAQFRVMLEDQAFKCKICDKSIADGGSAVVDHCHKTGAVRGLLCRKCNSGIGMLEDNPKVMRRAADYVAVRSA